MRLSYLIVYVAIRRWIGDMVLGNALTANIKKVVVASSPEETIREALTLRFDWKLNLEAREALDVLGRQLQQAEVLAARDRRQLAEQDEALRRVIRSKDWKEANDIATKALDLRIET